MTFEITNILKSEPKFKLGRNSKAFDYSSNLKSGSFEFYNDQFTMADQFEIGSAIKEEDINESPQEMIEAISFFQNNLNPDSVLVELGGSKFQRRSGFPYSIFNNYFPLDISRSSMIAYSELYDRVGIACNAEKLPFISNSIDAIFTHTFLEHPIDPDAVVKEIDRVLKYGGYIIHSDAWHCRWWKRFGVYGVIPFQELTFRKKLLYLVIAISELKIIRMPLIIFRRLIKEIFVSNSKNSTLKFKKLIPNYDLKIYSDEDAAANIDPLDLIHFYENKDYELVFKKSFFKRIIFNDTNVYLKKKLPK
jgi:ubiquinone/menaquinone biosynthesis C-methylase UbiE